MASSQFDVCPRCTCKCCAPHGDDYIDVLKAFYPEGADAYHRCIGCGFEWFTDVKGNIMGMDQGAISTLHVEKKSPAPSCPTCGAMMVPDGPQFRCMSCGAVNGMMLGNANIGTGTLNRSFDVTTNKTSTSLTTPMGLKPLPLTPLPGSKKIQEEKTELKIQHTLSWEEIENLPGSSWWAKELALNKILTKAGMRFADDRLTPIPGAAFYFIDNGKFRTFTWRSVDVEAIAVKKKQEPSAKEHYITEDTPSRAIELQKDSE